MQLASTAVYFVTKPNSYLLLFHSQLSRPGLYGRVNKIPPWPDSINCSCRRSNWKDCKKFIVNGLIFQFGEVDQGLLFFAFLFLKWSLEGRRLSTCSIRIPGALMMLLLWASILCATTTTWCSLNFLIFCPSRPAEFHQVHWAKLPQTGPESIETAVRESVT